ncbi:MAG: hypothetical protein LBT14_05190 [Treponema sp.]|jgi:hypothetical protein|nr:hypothetical protein [Treponema sp.]
MIVTFQQTMKNPFFFCILAVFILLGSCSGKINGSLNEDGSADLTIQAALEPRMAALIRSLSALSSTSGGQGAKPIIDGPAIGRSLSSAPGIKSASFNNTNATAIAGAISISQVDTFLAIPAHQGRGRFIRYEPDERHLVIELDRAWAPQMLALISPNVVDYLSILMAPVATEEVLSQREYLALVRSVYGKAVADEIAVARITASITFPRPISAIRGGVSSGNQAEFDIPLIDLLVLETPLKYEVSWK